MDRVCFGDLYTRYLVCGAVILLTLFGAIQRNLAPATTHQFITHLVARFTHQSELFS